MSGLAGATLLAGPFLRFASPDEILVWFATTRALLPSQVSLELWTPGETGLWVYDAPVAQVPFSAAGDIASSNELQSVRLTSNLFVHVLRLKPSSPLRIGEPYAYRVMMMGPPRVALPPPGVYERLPRADKKKTPPPAASFVLGGETAWWMWGTLAGLHDEWVASDAFVAKTLTPTGPALKTGPTHLFAFGEPFTASLPRSAFLTGVLDQLAVELAGPSATVREQALAPFAAQWLLALSPTVWDAMVPTPTPESAALRAVSAAAARLMANVPTWWLGPRAKAPTVLRDESVKAAVRAAFAAWPNALQQNRPLAAVLTTADAPNPEFRVAGAAGFSGCDDDGDVRVALDLETARGRFVNLVSAQPLIGAKAAGAAPPEVAARDVTFVLSATEGPAQILDNNPERDPSNKPEEPRYSTKNSGLPKASVYQATVSAGVAGAPTITKAARGKTKPGVLDVVAQTGKPVSASIQRTGTSVRLALRQGGSVVEEHLVQVPGHGRLVPLPQTAAAGFYLGNRMLLPSPATNLNLNQGQGDGGRFLDVEVEVHDWQPPGPGREKSVARQTKKAAATGLLPLTFGLAETGRFFVRLAGDKTFTHAGPDTPVGNNPRVDRVWKRHEIALEVRRGEIVSVDDEPIPGPAFRYLVDPVWVYVNPSNAPIGPRPATLLRAEYGQSPRPKARRLVDLVVIHSTDKPGADLAQSVRNWADGTNTHRPHYDVGRDGTCVKLVDESDYGSHAGRAGWRGRTDVNDRSVGIETESFVETQIYFTEPQYETLLTLVKMLVGMDRPVAGKPHARERSMKSPDYVEMAVVPGEVIGHGDCRFRDRLQILGGKADPHNRFEWARFEMEGIGLRRESAYSPLLGPVPEQLPRNKPTPSAAMVAQRLADKQAFAADVAFRKPNGTWMKPGDPELSQLLFDDLTLIGYWSGTQQDFLTRFRPPKNDTRLSTAVTAFSTHFFSGARRTEGGHEAMDTVDEQVALWIHRVAEELRKPNAKRP